MTLNNLIDRVVSQIKRDILDEETQALEILLSELSEDKLKSYLPESEENFAD
jgi:hypothetical protein